MEQSEEFARIKEIIRTLEVKKLSNADEEHTKEQELNGLIEAHFDKCMNALAARKEALLREVRAKFEEQRLRVAEFDEKVQKSLETCNKLLQTGASIYDADKKTAEHVWKGAEGVTQPTIVVEKISVNLPNKILEGIRVYGQVVVNEDTTYQAAASNSSYNLPANILSWNPPDQSNNNNPNYNLYTPPLHTSQNYSSLFSPPLPNPTNANTYSSVYNYNYTPTKKNNNKQGQK